MLKEIIAPGVYWYPDQKTGEPRSLKVTPDHIRYWQEQGNAMLSSGLTIPVPCEHDFDAHPMTPADKLKNNAGWVRKYEVKDGKLFGLLDIEDKEIAAKLPSTIKWTSPWFNSFVDGNGKQWNGVISHLALTTRPRIIKQEPFPSIAAALSMAAPIKLEPASLTDGFYLSRAGRLGKKKKDKKLRPRYPLAFSLYSGVKLSEDDDEYEDYDDDEEDDWDDDYGDEEGEEEAVEPVEPEQPVESPGTDLSAQNVTMEKLLCDLLNSLGVMMPENVGEVEFKRALYDATMAKIRELTAKAQGTENKMTQQNAQNAAANTTSPAGRTNPLIQQEQQPMYMSLEEINNIPDPTMRTIAMSMYQQNAHLSAQLAAQQKRIEATHQAELRKANTARATRVQLLCKLSPHVKADLESMLANPDMALSISENGAVVDPMSHVLAMLEKTLENIPRLLTTNQAALSIHSQPTDAEMLDQEEEQKLADDLARMMGCAPEKKTA